MSTYIVVLLSCWELFDVRQLRCVAQPVSEWVRMQGCHRHVRGKFFSKAPGKISDVLVIHRHERRYSAITQADARTSQRLEKVGTTLRWHLFMYLTANGNHRIDLHALTWILGFWCRGGLASIRQRVLYLPQQAERQQETAFPKRCSSTENHINANGDKGGG